MEVPLNPTQRKSFEDPKLIASFQRTDIPTPLELRTAVVFHTRGLHGNPVGVRLSHLSIMNRVLFAWTKKSLKQADSCSLTLPLSVQDSITQMFSPLLKGCTLHVFCRSDLKDMSTFVKTVARKGITRLSIPNHVFRSFLVATQQLDRQEAAKGFTKLLNITCRGGVLRNADVRLSR
jgi:non-ribosomal peptide synthetase component F